MIPDRDSGRSYTEIRITYYLSLITFQLKRFTMSIKFLGSFETIESLPHAKAPEYAFVGRSNVGKSSLLNALVGQKIARTSNTPGRTQSINLFEWQPSPAAGAATPPKEGNIILADLPGYGYAKASKTDVLRWTARTEKYLLTRASLKRLFILVDARHGLKPSDRDMVSFCDANAIQYQIILTKSDKVSRVESGELRVEIETEIKNHGASCGAVLATSAEKKSGIEELKSEIVKE